MEHWLSSSAGGNIRFETTQWSLVSRVGSEDEENRIAFESLYRSYSHPIYGFIRRRGYSRHEAQDLTQDFFLHLLQKNITNRADPLRGKFRTFLLSALGFFLLHANEKAGTQKRGGDAMMVFLDEETAEALYQLTDPAQTAEQIFDARWAATLVQATIDRLKAEMEAAGKGELFNQIRGFLIEYAKSSYAEAAQATGLTIAALKTAIHRLRVRYRDLLREEIARTVMSPADFDDEVRALRASLLSGYLRG
jgi:DNA-directed RNA polymerase specialized sigma24 family protein